MYKDYDDCILHRSFVRLEQTDDLRSCFMSILTFSASLPGISCSVVNKTISAGLVMCLARLQVNDNPACHYVCFVRPEWQEKGTCNPLSVDPLYLQLCTALSNKSLRLEASLAFW